MYGRGGNDQPSNAELTRAIVAVVLAVRGSTKRLPTLPPVSGELLGSPHRARDRAWLQSTLTSDVGLANRTLEMLGAHEGITEVFEQRSPRHVYAAAIVAILERDLLQNLPEDLAMTLRRRAMRRGAVAHEVARVAGADAMLAYVDGILADLGAVVLLRLDPMLAERIDAVPEGPGRHAALDRIVNLVGDDLVDRAVYRWLGADGSHRRPPLHVRQVTSIIYHHARRVDHGGARVLGTQELAPLVRLGIEARTFSELCEAARSPITRRVA